MNTPANLTLAGAPRFNIVLIIVAFSIFLLSLVWATVYTGLATEHDANVKAAKRNAANVARLVEEHTLRTMREADQVLLFIIDVYREHDGKIDLRRFAEDRPVISRIYNYFGIIDEHGMLKAGSSPFEPVNLADREHFQAHVARDSGQLFISKPVIGRASGKLSLQLSRRINRADLSFAGVAVVSIDPGYFTAFYRDLDLGDDSTISIAGTDGIVRAAVSAARPEDGIPRIVSTRSLKDYPLEVSVGISLGEALSGYRQRRQNHVVAGALVSVAIIAFTLLLLATLRRQQAFGRALAQTNRELTAASETNARQAAIIESSTDAIFSRTLDGTTLTWNSGAERLFGWRAAEIVGKPVEILVSPERRHEMPRNIAALREQGTVSAYDTVRLHRDGRPIEVSVMLSPIRDRSGEMSGVSVIMRDITERRRAERALQELAAALEGKVAERTAALQSANEHLQSFAYSVSHDLRAPLRAVEGFAKALDDNTASLDAENRKRIGRIRGGARRMTELIDSLLHFSRLGQVQIAARPHDVDALVHKVVQEISAQYPRVKFEINGLGQTRGDASLLRQVWVNLIGNAAKFSDKSENPSVEIGCVEQAGEQVFRVKDNGAGFDMQYAGKLFGLFQRMHSQEEFPGTGAGLAIVKRIVERHGGRVWAEAAPGKGASFYFTLSVPAASGLAAPESGSPESSQ